MFIPPAAFEFEYFASLAAIAMTGVILLVGWFTRTLAVVWLALTLGLIWSVVIGIAVAYQIDGGSELEMMDIVMFRLLAGVQAILMGVTIWISIKLWRRRPIVTPSASSPFQPPQPPAYDHDWILSLLQSHLSKSDERLAISSCRSENTTAAPSTENSRNP